MKKIESYVKKWYDELEKGKVYGTRCKKCGALEFPPLPICNKCGNHDMEWVEIDGRGTLITYDDCTQPVWGLDLGPVLSGIVKLEEGTTIQAFVLGVADEDRTALFDKLPVNVHVEIQQRNGYKYPAFRVDEA